MQQTPFKIGDRVRVIRIPPHIQDPQYRFQEVKDAFAVALGNTCTVEDVDWGGWVWLYLGDENGAIGVQPDCVELA